MLRTGKQSNTSGWTEATHLEVLPRPYDVQTYGEYLQWYVPQSCATLTLPPPERLEQMTHQKSLRHSFGRHSASRCDDTLELAQCIVSASETSIRSPHTVPGLLNTLKYIFAE